MIKALLVCLVLSCSSLAWAAPTALIAWTDTNAGATAYVIQCKQGTSNYTTDLATTSVGAKTFTHTLVQGPGTYCYRIAAVNGTSRSTYSPDACSTLLAPAITLKVPTGVTVTITP